MKVEPASPRANSQGVGKRYCTHREANRKQTSVMARFLTRPHRLSSVSAMAPATTPRESSTVSWMSPVTRAKASSPRMASSTLRAK
ncbi:hypothetical protein D3C87_1331020 [compost metagenome]